MRKKKRKKKGPIATDKNSISVTFGPRCILTLKHVHVDRRWGYVLRLTRVIAAVRRVCVRHDEIAFRAVDVYDQAPVRVEVDHPVQMVPEHEQRSLRGPL